MKAETVEVSAFLLSLGYIPQEKNSFSYF